MAFSGLTFDEYGLHPPAIFSEVLSKALADHLGYAIFAGTIKGKNQLYRRVSGYFKPIEEEQMRLVEERTGERDHETADGNLPELEIPSKKSN